MTGDKSQDGPPANVILGSADLERGLRQLESMDYRLARAIKATGTPPLRLAEPGIAPLARLITEQQISLSAAAAIWQRMLEAFQPFEAATLVSAPDELYRACGQSAQKIRTLRSLAEAVGQARLELDGLAALSDGDARQMLMKVNGIGPWTAEVYLLSCLGRADAFPASDIALRESARFVLELPARPEARELEAIAESWRPWRSVAARVLWSAYRLRKFANYPGG